jgi:hypothetical protein
MTMQKCTDGSADLTFCIYTSELGTSGSIENISGIFTCELKARIGNKSAAGHYGAHNQVDPNGNPRIDT